MTENQDVETLTAKASRPDLPAAVPPKRKRWVIALIWALSIVLALCVGAMVGGGVVYGVIRVKDRFATSRVLPSIRTFRFGPGESTVEVPTSGALIVEVTKGSPAEQAGLQVGDVIVAVNGQELDTEHDLAGQIAALKPGDEVTLQVWQFAGRRAGPDESFARRSSEVRVQLGEHPERESDAYLGVSFAPFPGGSQWMERERPSGDFQFRFDCQGSECDQLPFGDGTMPFFRGMPFQNGVIVQRVVEDSPASGAGLQVGDVITTINGDPVEAPGSLSETIQGMKPGDEIALEVYRPEGEQEINIDVTLGEHPDNKGQAYLGVEIGGFFHMERSFEGDENLQPFRFFSPPDNGQPGGKRWFEFPGTPQGSHGDVSF
jgi:S1-C subfamily serine protease